MLIVGGGCRGRRLASALVADGQVVRVSTRSDAARSAIEATGAECWIGTPDRLATLRGALDGVTILCWLLATATGPTEELRALHTSRLEFFITQAIDTTVRGIVYEAPATMAAAALVARGAEIARALSERNAIPARLLTADPGDGDAWLRDALASIRSML